MKNNTQLPTWFIVLTALMFVSNLLVFGLASLIYPTLAFPDAGQGGVFPTQFFAVRHIAFAFPLLYGLLRKDIKILTVMYSIFIVMSVLDIALLGLFDYYIPILGLIPIVEQLPLVGKLILAIGLFLLPVGSGLWFLTKQPAPEQSRVSNFAN